MGIGDVWEAVEKLRQAFKMEPVAFDPVSSAVTAIDNVWLRHNTDCRSRRKLLRASSLPLLCFSSSVTLNLTSNLYCLRKHSL